MSNPFDRAESPVLVLLNEEEQYSLWPSFLPVPHGWRQAYGPAPHGECVSYVDANWVDMRPASLRKAA